MTEDEMRGLAIGLLNPRTARDAQKEVGASNLSNPCDHCRAWEISGVERTAPILDSAWGGRVVGTSLHARLEEHTKVAASAPSETGDDLQQIGWKYPGIQAERHLVIGELLEGRVIRSTTDLWIPSEHAVGDHKNTDLRKLAYLRDAVAMMRGEEIPFGRDSDYVAVYMLTTVKSGKRAGEVVYRKASKGVSERVYADEIAHAQYKIARYSRQLHFYGLGLENEGETVKQLFLSFIARDSAMTTDSVESQRFYDPKAPHGVWALEFAYNHDYAVGLWKNAQAMAKALDEGTKTPADYPSDPMCGVCAEEAKRAEKAPTDETVLVPVGVIDEWAA